MVPITDLCYYYLKKNNVDNIIPGVQNEAFGQDIDILDFTEINPFGEII